MAAVVNRVIILRPAGPRSRAFSARTAPYRTPKFISACFLTIPRPLFRTLIYVRGVSTTEGTGASRGCPPRRHTGNDASHSARTALLSLQRPTVCRRPWHKQSAPLKTPQRQCFEVAAHRCDRSRSPVAQSASVHRAAAAAVAAHEAGVEAES